MQNKDEKKIEKLLEKRFSDKEVKIYMALLKIGKGTVSEITRSAGVGRTYGYPILAQLTSQGLVGISGKKPKQEYFAESPRVLFDYMENRLKSEKNFTKELKEALPELLAIHNVEDRPRIRFYEGLEGIKNVYDDTLTSKEKVVRGFLAYDELFKTLPNYFPEYFKRRAEKGVVGKAIATETEEGRNRERKNKDEARELIFVPKKYYFYPEIDIYDNKVMIASWREKLGIIIESDEVADAMKKIFELAWIGAEHLKSKE